jgi:hypothetical protein
MSVEELMKNSKEWSTDFSGKFFYRRIKKIEKDVIKSTRMNSSSHVFKLVVQSDAFISCSVAESVAVTFRDDTCCALEFEIPDNVSY